MNNKICSLFSQIALTGLGCVLLCLMFGFSYSSDTYAYFWISFAVSLLIITVFGLYIHKKQKTVVPELDLSLIFAGIFILGYGIYLRFLNNPLYLMMFGFMVLIMFALFLACRKELNVNKAIILLVFAGFILRLVYIFLTDVSDNLVRQHDVGSFGTNIGHSGYIEYLLNNRQLPDFDPRTIWQFYHPPLHHAISAVWIKIQTLLGITYNAAVEGLQYLTLFYSLASSLISIAILKLFGLKDRFLLLGSAIVVFSPAFTLFAGSINNDILSVLFIFASIYTSWKWYQTEKLTTLLLTALFIGLGMMTKLSAASIAIPIGALMILYFIKTKEKKECIEYYTLFGIIVFPLGLWWPIRNLVQFDVPVSYVPKLSNSVAQYVGFRSFWERYLPFAGFGDKPWFSWSGEHEYNAFSGLFKSSAFGEYVLSDFSEISGKLSYPLLVFTMAVCILSFIAMLYVLTIKGIKGKWFMLSIYCVVLISYLYFCDQYPFTCTMNIRYASPLIVVGAYFLGLALQKLKETNVNKNNKVLSAITNLAFPLSAISVTGFSVFSVIAYALL